MKLVVTSLATAQTACEQHLPHAILSLLAPEQFAPHFGLSRRLHLAFNDVDVDSGRLIAPKEEDVGNLLSFVDSLPAHSTLLIYCWMGISRSTAASLAIACARCPSLDETSAARTLRRLSPCATPNRRLIYIADRLLQRRGRLQEATRGIGRGAEFTVVSPFIWDV